MASYIPPLSTLHGWPDAVRAASRVLGMVTPAPVTPGVTATVTTRKTKTITPKTITPAITTR